MSIVPEPKPCSLCTRLRRYDSILLRWEDCPCWKTIKPKIVTYPKKYRRRVFDIEAIQYTGSNFKDIESFVGKNKLFEASTIHRGNFIVIMTDEGNMRAQPGHWVIKGIRGEFYACHDDVFKKGYEEII